MKSVMLLYESPSYYLKSNDFHCLLWPMRMTTLRPCRLYEAQQGEMPSKAKPLKGFSGVIEIKTDYRGDTYRTIYTVKIGNHLYVLHVFKKKSKKGIATPKPDINIIKSRLKIAQKLAGESNNE